jgi:hypothetical protein
VSGSQSKPTVERGPVGIHAHQIGVAIGVGLADIARRAAGDVQLAIGSEGDEFAAVTGAVRKGLADQNGGRRRVQLVLDIVEAQDAISRRGIEGAAAKRNADRSIQARRDGRHPRRRTGPQRDRVDVAGARGSRKQRALGPEHHRARIVEPRQDFDLEAGRQADLVERERRLRAGRHGGANKGER